MFWRKKPDVEPDMAYLVDIPVSAHQQTIKGLRFSVLIWILAISRGKCHASAWESQPPVT